MDSDTLEGRELDAAVAEARGWTKGERYWMNPSKPDALWGGTGYTVEEGHDYDFPHYRPTEHIAIAWELVEELEADEWTWTLYGGTEYVMVFRHPDKGVGIGHDKLIETAISRAYLKAKEAQ